MCPSTVTDALKPVPLKDRRPDHLLARRGIGRSCATTTSRERYDDEDRSFTRTVGRVYTRAKRFSATVLDFAR